MKLQTWIEEVKEKGKEAQSPYEKLGDGNEMRWEMRVLEREVMCGTCVWRGRGRGNGCAHYSHTCQNTDGRNVEAHKGSARPSEAASSASRQNVFFTQTQMAGTSLLKSSGQ